MTQMTIVYIIGGFLILYLIYKMYRVLNNKGYKRVCHNCPIGKDCSKAKALRDGCEKNGRPTD